MTVKVLDYVTSTDYTYDAAEIEVTGGVAQLLAKTYSNELFFVDFNEDNNPNANRASGNKYATSVAAPISSGYLDLTGGTQTYVSYDSDNLAGFTNTGCVRIGFVPDYSGSPPSGQYLFSTSSNSGNTNIFIVQHELSGNMRIQIFNSAGGGLVDINAAFVAVSGQAYVLEVNFDITSGASRLFIDGVQLGATSTSIGTRIENQNRFNIGISHSLNGVTSVKIDYLQLFSEVQNTANHTPISTLETYDKVFQGIINKATISTGSLIGFYACELNGNTESKYVINLNAVDYYWSGSAWVTSSGSAQSNTADDVNTNIATFAINSSDDVLFKAYIRSVDGYDNPKLDSILIDYSSAPAEPGALSECIVTSVFKDSKGDAIVGATVKFIPNAFWYDQTYVFEETITTTDANGEISISIVETASSNATMNIRIEYKNGTVVLYKNKIIPNQVTDALSNIIAT